MEDREPYITGGNVRDKFLTEAMGEHYHTGFVKCECGKENVNRVWPTNPDFSTWEGFGKLWEWSNKQEWREDLIDQTWQDLKGGEFQPDWFDSQLGVMPHLINPDRLADAIYEYLKNKV